MKMFIKSNPKTGVIEKISPISFEECEEIHLSEDHPFLQELFRSNVLPVSWKNNNGEVVKLPVKIEKNYNLPKLNLKPFVELKQSSQLFSDKSKNNENKFVWQTPWLIGTFFITHNFNRWKILKIFELGESGDGTFQTNVFDFQLFSITDNDKIYEQEIVNGKNTQTPRH